MIEGGRFPVQTVPSIQDISPHQTLSFVTAIVANRSILLHRSRASVLLI